MRTTALPAGTPGRSVPTINPTLAPTGILRVASNDIKRSSSVQLLLKATGSVRVTLRGSVVAELNIAGQMRCLCIGTR